MFKPLMFLFLVFQLLPAAALQKRFPKAMPLSEGNRHFLFFPPDSGAAFAPDIADLFLEHGAAKSPAFL